MKKRILIVVAELGYRGTPRTVANYVRMLADEYQVAVWGYDEGGETADDLVKSGCRVFLGAEAEALALAYKPDIVNFHRQSMFSSRETELMMYFKLQGAFCVETSVFGRVDRTVSGILDLSIQISDWDYYRWKGWGGASYCIGAAMIPNPVDVDGFRRVGTDEIHAFREKLSIPDEGVFVLGRIGKTSWRMMGRALYNALIAIDNLHVILVDDYSGHVPEVIQRHERVHQCSRLSGSKALCTFYSSCNAIVNISQTGESFGFVNAEAMACETPVITLSTPFHDDAQLEMVDDFGIVLSDRSELTNGINRLYNRIRNLEEIGCQCRKSIVERYSVDVLKSRLLNVFRCVECGRVEDAINFAPPFHHSKDMYGKVRELHGIIEAYGVRLFHTATAYAVLRWCKAGARMVRSMRRMKR